MRYVALEEAFAVPELASRQPATQMRIRVTDEYAAMCGRKLVDFEHHRLPDMDAHGIDIQVLSLTAPGIQADVDPAAAHENARVANDFLAEVVAQHPTRFQGFAALPTQDPGAAVTELERAVSQLGFRGALVNDHAQGRYLDVRRTRSCGGHSNSLACRCTCTPARCPPTTGTTHHQHHMITNNG